MTDLLGYLTFFVTSALIFSVAALGLNVQWGMTGLFNAGVAGFFAIGAYTSAILTTEPSASHIGGFGLPVAIGWAAAMGVSGVIAALLGILTLRLREDYLAITTFGIAIVIQTLLTNLQRLSGGPFGISFIPKPFGSLASNLSVFGAVNLLLVGLVVVVLYVLLETLARSPWGRVLRSIREDATAAASLGKNVSAYKVQAFVLGSAIMGIGGAMQAHFIGFISPDGYLPILTFQVWAMLIVGGSGNNRGAILGSLVVWGLWTLSGYVLSQLVPASEQARVAALRPIIIGLSLVAILMYRPSGLMRERRHVHLHSGGEKEMQQG